MDLEYPDYLHDEHNDLPCAPEHILVTDEMLSPYSLQMKECLKVKSAPVKKLIASLSNKQNYTLHFKLLKLYLSLGLKLTKIHRILQFEQKAFLKPYIELNTKMRQNSKSEFEKNFYKLMVCFA